MAYSPFVTLCTAPYSSSRFPPRTQRLTVPCAVRRSERNAHMHVEVCYCWSHRSIFWSAVFWDVMKGSGKSLSVTLFLLSQLSVCTNKHKDRPPQLVSTITSSVTVSILWTATSPGQCSDLPLRFQKCSEPSAVGVEFSCCNCSCCFLFDATVTFQRTVLGI